MIAVSSPAGSLMTLALSVSRHRARAAAMLHLTKIRQPLITRCGDVIGAHLCSRSHTSCHGAVLTTADNAEPA